jgi:hypothetical protein
MEHPAMPDEELDRYNGPGYAARLREVRPGATETG